MKHLTPPRLAEKFLLFFLKKELAEEVLGDLEERFYFVADQSPLKAKLNYWHEVFNYLRPFAFNFFTLNSKLTTMTGHNFRISSRIILKNKVFSLINIGGLAMGMTVAILIGLWIYDEFSFNKNHEHYDRIVQVLRKDMDDSQIEVNSSHPGMVGIFLSETYPALFDKVMMTFFRTNKQTLSVDRQDFSQQGYFIQKSGPEMLSLPMQSGRRDCLADKNSILISTSLANKLFGQENPMEQTITLNTRTELKVAGVYKDLPFNSEFGDATFFASLELIYNADYTYTWDNYNMKAYALLQPNVTIKQAEEGIKNMMIAHTREGRTPSELFLNPMSDWHLNSSFENGVEVTGKRLEFVRLYGVIGIFVLLLACINFMNLNTARYQNRTKEIGIRKTVGSLRSHLISQFLIESLIYTFASLIITLLAVQLILPWFNSIADKSISLPWTNLSFLITIISFTIATALIAGSYPALFLSSFSPIKALNGSIKQGISGARFRQVLVVFQFTVSLTLIIGTITVYNQIQFAKSRDVGYNQEGLITLSGRSKAYYQKYDVLRDELKKTGAVIEMAEANYPLTNTLGNNDDFSWEGKKSNFWPSFNTIYVTPEYGRTLEWKIINGRDFSRQIDSDNSSVIINESAAKIMGFSNPIGQQIQSTNEYKGRKNFTILGVTKDILKGDPFESAMPAILFPSERSMSWLFIKINPSMSYLEAIPKIQEAFESVLPNHPFLYEFIDDEYSKKFKEEELIGSLALLFSVLAVLISCLGLFGLSAFIAEQRIKEIGIRKVLGASISNLWQLLSKDFSILILIACTIAVPLAYLFLDKWLQNYEHRVDIEWTTFLITALGGLLITVITVSFHALKASFANPIDSLRSE